MKLGKWAVIDIETTGLDPSVDSIIDIGFLHYDNLTLVNRYSSLVAYEHNLPQVIQKLTGITSKMVAEAPHWEIVETELLELFDHSLIAHNASFEKSFLDRYFINYSSQNKGGNYCDSIAYLALLFPWREKLNLQEFLFDFKIAEFEKHRGLDDSIDLLKVLLVSSAYVNKHKELSSYIKNCFNAYNLSKDIWLHKFLYLSIKQLQTIADSIDFSVEDALINLEKFVNKKTITSFGNKEIDQEFQVSSFSSDGLKKLYRNENFLSNCFESYNYREAQEQLSIKVGQSFANDVHSLIQAPTGVGKTLGYLLPIALYSLDNKEPVLVSTGTKVLQNQLMEKDIPLLRKILNKNEEELKVVKLIGSGNHLCELLYRQQEKEQLPLAEEEFQKRFSDAYFDIVFFYNSINKDLNKKIVRASIPSYLKKLFTSLKVREKEVSVDFRSCSGVNCPFKEDCSYYQALKEARDANIIICNHALLFNWSRSLSKPKYIIVDEAHKIEEESTKVFTRSISEDNFKHILNIIKGDLFFSSLLLLLEGINPSDKNLNIVNELRDIFGEIRIKLEDNLKVLSEIISEIFLKTPRYTDKFWNEIPMLNKKNISDEIELSVLNRIEAISYSLDDCLFSLKSIFEKINLENIPEELSKEHTYLSNFYELLSDISCTLSSALREDDDYAHSICYHELYGYKLLSYPIDIGKLTYEQLIAPANSVVFTSATLANSSGDYGFRGIEWALGYSYVEPSSRFRNGFFIPPVYDYKRQSQVFLCDDIPNLNESEFIPNCLDRILQVIKGLNGRSLLLFSAYNRFNQACEIIIRELDRYLPLHIQNFGRNIIEDFKKQGGVLVGMESLSEGIDIPGDNLQFIFIDKIPDVRQEFGRKKRQDFFETKFSNQFYDYYMAYRTRSLHQKLGRLIRSENDIGSIIIADSRIKRWKGKTIEKFLSMMKPYDIKRVDLEDACKQSIDFIKMKDQAFPLHNNL